MRKPVRQLAAALGWECTIQAERPQFTLWRTSIATGSKLECLGHYRDKRECRRAWARAVRYAAKQKVT